MPADQTDQDLKAIYALLAEGKIDGAAAQRAAETAHHARRRNDPSQPSKPPAGRCGASRRREKMFGIGRPIPLDRNVKVRIMHWARCLSRRTEPGSAYGQITAKALAVLEALLWAFHNCRSGLCFPSYERIAEAADAPARPSPGRFMRWKTLASFHGSIGSSGCGCAAPICSARTACAWCRSGPATPIISPIPRPPPDGQILLRPIFSLEQRTKVFSLR